LLYIVHLLLHHHPIVDLSSSPLPSRFPVPSSSSSSSSSSSYSSYSSYSSLLLLLLLFRPRPVVPFMMHLRSFRMRMSRGVLHSMMCRDV